MSDTLESNSFLISIFSGHGSILIVFVHLISESRGLCGLSHGSPEGPERRGVATGWGEMPAPWIVVGEVRMGGGRGDGPMGT